MQTQIQLVEQKLQILFCYHRFRNTDNFSSLVIFSGTQDRLLLFGVSCVLEHENRMTNESVQTRARYEVVYTKAFAKKPSTWEK